MRFAIAGCGLIGQKRLKALTGRHCLAVATDPVAGRAERLAAQAPGARVEADWRRAVDAPDVEAVIVATTNDALAPVAVAAIEAGKHVMVEKPAARSLEELEMVLEKSRQSVQRVQVGFNHRFHPAFCKARQILDTGALGELMFIRARYGHGGRVGYDREWRANPRLSGGGELLDQGVHLIDLSRWFLGEFTSIAGFAHTYYWDMPVEDNGFLMLRTAAAQCAFLHASCTEWKNLFSFEIYGRKAKLHIEGLGGSYGVERLYYYAMKPEMGPPDTTIWEYPGDDRSWQRELEVFAASIDGTGPPGPDLEDAAAALRIVDQVYRSSGYPKFVSAPEES
jgi:predicted dehydrogenase